jgi:aspartate aminotransferase
MMKEIPNLKLAIPEGAFYVLPDVSWFFGKSDGETKINNADDLAMYLLNKALVATVSGKAFGIPECIRISYATSDDVLEKAISRIKEALADLK